MARDLELALLIRADVRQALREMKRMGGGVEQLGRQGERAGSKLDQAFGRLGLRSFATIRREIAATRAAYRRLARSGRLSSRELSIAHRRMRQQIRDLRRELRGAAAGGRSLGRALGGIGVAYAGVRALQGLVRTTDQYKLLTGQLRLVTESEEELVDVEQRLFAIAQRTRSGYAETVQLYARVARSSRDLGVSQQELLDITETINKAIQVSGATAQEAAAGVIQLSQGLAAGALRGEELNSVAEQMPRLLEAIIKGVNEVNPALGLTRQNFRELASEGKLTTELIVAALQTQAGVIDQEFARLPRTVDQALTQLSNDLQRAFRDVDMQPLVDAIDELREVVTDPAFVQTVTELASALVKLTSAAASGVRELGDFGDQLGELAAYATGALHPLQQLEIDIRDVTAALNAPTRLDRPFRFFFSSREELLRLRDQLIAERDALLAASGALQSAQQAAAQRAEGSRGSRPDRPPVPTGPSEDFLAAQADLERRIALLGRESAEQQVLWEIERGRYRDLAQNEKDALLALARRLDAGREALQEAEEQRRAQEQARIEQQRYNEELDRAAQAIRDTLDPMEPLRRELEQLNELLATGRLSWEEWSEATLRVQERMDELNTKSDEALKEVNQYAIGAARGIQSALADFLFDPFEDGLEGMVAGFADVIRRMLAEAAAAKLAEALFGDIAGGNPGGLVGSFLVGLFHGGGVVGEAVQTREVNPALFLNAPRLHMGLRADEFPAILQRGEEVLAKDDPRNSANGAAGQAVRIVNVIDPSMMQDYIASAAGERVILNVLERNAGAIRQVLA